MLFFSFDYINKKVEVVYMTDATRTR